MKTHLEYPLCTGMGLRGKGYTSTHPNFKDGTWAGVLGHALCALLAAGDVCYSLDPQESAPGQLGSCPANTRDPCFWGREGAGPSWVLVIALY